MPDAPFVITVFGSSRPVAGDDEYEKARALGRALAERGFTICTGGYGGVMEAASRGAKEAGGQTLAITASFFRAQANRYVDKEIRVKTWQDRLFELIRIGAGYVACRGGTGTLVELAVVWEMLNKGVMDGKPLVVLGEFWIPIVDQVRSVETGTYSPWREGGSPLIHTAATPTAAADHLAGRLTSLSTNDSIIKDDSGGSRLPRRDRAFSIGTEWAPSGSRRPHVLLTPVPPVSGNLIVAERKDSRFDFHNRLVGSEREYFCLVDQKCLSNLGQTRVLEDLEKSFPNAINRHVTQRRAGYVGRGGHLVGAAENTCPPEGT